jgi:hypothetical protein
MEHAVGVDRDCPWPERLEAGRKQLDDAAAG